MCQPLIGDTLSVDNDDVEHLLLMLLHVVGIPFHVGRSVYRAAEHGLVVVLAYLHHDSELQRPRLPGRTCCLYRY